MPTFWLIVFTKATSEIILWATTQAESDLPWCVSHPFLVATVHLLSSDKKVMNQWIGRTRRTDCYLHMNRLKFKTWGKKTTDLLRGIQKNIYLKSRKPKTEPGRDVSGWNRKHSDLIPLCPKKLPRHCEEATHRHLHMNQLSLTNNQLKFKTSGKLPTCTITLSTVAITLQMLRRRRSDSEPQRWWRLQVTWICFRAAIFNSFFINMAVDPKIAKTWCIQSGATAVMFLGAQKVCRIL